MIVMLEWRMIIHMSDDIKELREALGIVRLAPKLEIVLD